MGEIYDYKNWLLVEESKLGTCSLTKRKEHCEMSMGLQDNLPLKVLLNAIRLDWYQNNSLNKKASTKLKPLLLLQSWILFNWFFPLLHILDGAFTKWMSKVLFFMDICIKNLYGITTWFFKIFKSCFSTEEIFVWFEISTLCLVWKDWSFLPHSWFQALWIWS